MSSTPPTPRTVAFAIDISHSSGFQGEGVPGNGVKEGTEIGYTNMGFALQKEIPNLEIVIFKVHASF